MSNQESPTADEVKAQIRKAALNIATRLSTAVLNPPDITAAAAFFSAPVVADALNVGR